MCRRPRYVKVFARLLSRTQPNAHRTAAICLILCGWRFHGNGCSIKLNGAFGSDILMITPDHTANIKFRSALL